MIASLMRGNSSLAERSIRSVIVAPSAHPGPNDERAIPHISVFIEYSESSKDRASWTLTKKVLALIERRTTMTDVSD